jgi:hypothetical protein
LLTEHADRFMLGVDTYTPQRWLKNRSETDWMQSLLAVLPENVAEQIAWRNGKLCPQQGTCTIN